MNALRLSNTGQITDTFSVDGSANKSTAFTAVKTNNGKVMFFMFDSLASESIIVCDEHLHYQTFMPNVWQNHYFCPYLSE